MKKYIYLLLATVSIAFWYACTPPLEGVTLKLPEAVKSSNVIVQFKPDNSAAGDLPSNISITIAGKDSAKVVNIIGGKDFKVKQNVLALAASPDFTPTASNPLNFVVVAEADGYLKSVTPVTLTSTKDLNLSIALTKISTPAKGITVVQQPATVSSAGTTSAAISVVTPANNGITEKATVVIPSGTTVKDGSGAPVGGNLNIVVTKADASKTQAPVQVDRNEISKIVDKNNQPLQDFSITPIVGVDIEITNELNQKVKNFSGQIDVKTEIPNGTVDPITKQPLKAGDLMMITSFDEDTKTYKYEGPATIALNSSGKLEVSGKVNHLTTIYFALYSTFYVIVIASPAVPEKFVEEVAKSFGVPVAVGKIRIYEDYYINLVGEIGQYASEEFNFDFLDLNGEHYYNTTDSRSGIKVSSSVIITKITITNKVGEQVMTVNNPTFSNVNGKSTASLSVPASPNFINFIANLACNDASKKTNANNIQVYSKPVGATDSQYLYLGKANTSNGGFKLTGTTTLLKRSGTYDFKFVVGNTNFYYPGKKVSSGADFTITSTMPDALCF